MSISFFRPGLIGALTAGAILAIVLIGFAIWIFGLFALGIWAVYRIVRGWMRLNSRLPMP